MLAFSFSSPDAEDRGVLLAVGWKITDLGEGFVFLQILVRRKGRRFAWAWCASKWNTEHLMLYDFIVI